MPKPRTENGGKNLISRQLIELRKRDNYSQRDLAYRLQLEGCDMDKNAITRIETDKRYVSDFEIKALSDIFHVSYEYKKKEPKTNALVLLQENLFRLILP